MRVLFPKREQNKFINKLLSKISVKEAAKICGLSERTVRDWRREKFLIEEKALKLLCKKTRIKFPNFIKLVDPYWYVSKSARLGGMAVYEKYGRVGGNPEYRKKKWYEWWEREGKYKKHPIINVAKPINKPPFSKQLAEFMGIVLGDGGMTSYQVSITLNIKERSSYGNFIILLIKKLFNIPVGLYYMKDASAFSIIISRKKLVDFFLKLGLKTGNKVKKQVDIPEWIKKNKQYSIACLRGLIDTDGCIYNHRYKSGGKIYSYKKIAFASASIPLRKSVFSILKDLKLNPRFGGRIEVKIENIKNVKKYLELVGSNNGYFLNK
ncbi:MAG: hypothetical protein ABID67_02445 [Candidatus Nealsonbacteria bacterium]